MRACYPDEEGFIERDGVKIGYEVFGSGSPTIVLLPTWTIIHTRFWKMQIPYLARHFRVVTFDGPGNGRSDRPLEPDAYGPARVAQDALDVMDATGVDRAVLVALSRGAEWGLKLAAEHSDRVLGAVFIGAAVEPHHPERAEAELHFFDPAPTEPGPVGTHERELLGGALGRLRRVLLLRVLQRASLHEAARRLRAAGRSRRIPT